MDEIEGRDEAEKKEYQPLTTANPGLAPKADEQETMCDGLRRLSGLNVTTFSSVLLAQVTGLPRGTCVRLLHRMDVLGSPYVRRLGTKSQSWEMIEVPLGDRLGDGPEWDPTQRPKQRRPRLSTVALDRRLAEAEDRIETLTKDLTKHIESHHE